MESNAADDDVRGTRTIVETLFCKAEHDPERLFGSFCRTDNVEDGFHDFTFRQLANAVDSCAWFIKDTFGESTTFEPLLYLGINDYRYTIVLYAAIKCGYKALFINPKYPLRNILTIMESTECMKVLHSTEFEGIVKEISKKAPSTRASEMAPPLHWLSDRPTPFPFYKTWENSKEDPILVLHSSGTTGSPKAIPYSNAWIALQDWFCGGLTLREAFNDGFTYSQLPQCHYGGVLNTNLRPLFTRSAASVLGPPNANSASAADLALQIIKLKGIRSLAATPLLLEGIVELPGGMETLRELNCVTFSGGPLRSELGDAMVEAGIELHSTYGTTELGSCPRIPVDTRDWEWNQFHPDIHASFEPTDDGANTHELVFLDHGYEINRRRGTFWSLGSTSYRTKDLFVPHPRKAHLWKYHGRRDDILFLANGGKFNPIPVEDVVAKHPDVHGAMVAGMHRHPPCLLIEPKEEPADATAFLQNAQLSLAEANELLREDLRIPGDKILLLRPGQLVRGLKGQVVRKATEELHAELINTLYGTEHASPEAKA